MPENQEIIYGKYYTYSYEVQLKRFLFGLTCLTFTDSTAPDVLLHTIATVNVTILHRMTLMT